MLGYQILHPCCNIGILLVTYKITNNVPTLDHHFTCLPMLFQFGILNFFLCKCFVTGLHISGNLNSENLGLDSTVSGSSGMSFCTILEK